MSGSTGEEADPGTAAAATTLGISRPVAAVVDEAAPAARHPKRRRLASSTSATAAPCNGDSATTAEVEVHTVSARLLAAKACDCRPGKLGAHRLRSSDYSDLLAPAVGANPTIVFVNSGALPDFLGKVWPKIPSGALPVISNGIIATCTRAQRSIGMRVYICRTTDCSCDSRFRLGCAWGALVGGSKARAATPLAVCTVG